MKEKTEEILACLAITAIMLICIVALLTTCAEEADRIEKKVQTHLEVPL
ncbi:MAG: hypothetical protein DDT41_01674 [candidate division WS2 bacterium]|nr:hypothetical protein [Candidatus Psychracetigena formicireducens]